LRIPSTATTTALPGQKRAMTMVDGQGIEMVLEGREPNPEMDARIKDLRQAEERADAWARCDRMLEAFRNLRDDEPKMAATCLKKAHDAAVSASKVEGNGA
jgi:hypothetical protein